MGKIKSTCVPSRNNPTATETEAAAGDRQEGRISLPAAALLPAFAFPHANRSGQCSSASPRAVSLHPSLPAHSHYSCIHCSSIHRVLPPRLAQPPQGLHLSEGSASFWRYNLLRTASVAAPGTHLEGTSHKTLFPATHCIRGHEHRGSSSRCPPGCC